MTTSRARTARADRTAATRRRITTAAARMFVERGYLETTMAGLAGAAGVAVQTLYLSFGSKAAVLEAALAESAQDHPTGWLQRLRAEPDGAAALAEYVSGATAALERQYPLTAVLRAAAADPEPAELLARMQHGAFAQHTAAIDELADKPGFTTAISLQRATEILAGMLAPQTYALFVADHGWTPADWAEWTTRHVRGDLFPATMSESG